MASNWTSLWCVWLAARKIFIKTIAFHGREPSYPHIFLPTITDLHIISRSDIPCIDFMLVHFMNVETVTIDFIDHNLCYSHLLRSLPNSWLKLQTLSIQPVPQHDYEMTPEFKLENSQNLISTANSHPDLKDLQLGNLTGMNLQKLVPIANKFTIVKLLWFFQQHGGYGTSTLSFLAACENLRVLQYMGRSISDDIVLKDSNLLSLVSVELSVIGRAQDYANLHVSQLTPIGQIFSNIHFAPNLEHLYIRFCFFRKTDMQHLRNFKKLKTLKFINNCPTIEWQDILQPISTRNLTTLLISSRNLNALSIDRWESFIHRATFSTSLHNLHVGQCNVNDICAIASILGACTNIQTVRFDTWIASAHFVYPHGMKELVNSCVSISNIHLCFDIHLTGTCHCDWNKSHTQSGDNYRVIETVEITSEGLPTLLSLYHLWPIYSWETSNKHLTLDIEFDRLISCYN